MRRVLIYALVYGAIGAGVGVMVALYTKDVPPVPIKTIDLNPNGSSANARVVKEPAPQPQEVTKSGD